MQKRPGMKECKNMSTYHLTATIQRWKSWYVALLAILCGLLSISLLCSPSAFAFSTHDRSSPPVPPEDITRAGVSVIRLEADYTDTKSNVSSLCTGLGVLIKSWTATSGNDQNNWVLTDSTLIHRGNGTTCVPSHSPMLLSIIRIYMSTAYGQNLPFTTLDAKNVEVRCPQNSCEHQLALFSFNTDAEHTQPYLDLSLAKTPQGVGIELAKNTNPVTVPKLVETNEKHFFTYQTAIQQSLTPLFAAQNVPKEPGMPIVDSQGQLQALSLANGAMVSASVMKNFLDQQQEFRLPHINLVHDGWNDGVTDFYASNLSSAHASFAQAVQANPQFQAAKNFADRTALPNSSETGRTNSNNSDKPPAGISYHGIHLPYWLLGLIVLILLALLLIFISIFFGRSRTRHRRRIAEYTEAQRSANREVQRIKETEAMQQNSSNQQAQQNMFTASTGTPPPASIESLPQASTGPLPPTDVRCPRCSTFVQAGANFCPNCNLALVSPNSGSYVRVLPQPPVSATRLLADQPTLEMSPSRQGNSVSEIHKTEPYTLQQVQGRHPGFVVGTRTDPGIKRKHKPNEDSLFAAQGMRAASSSLQQIGLFVVADGMGGHANGQDASRMAIQTVINYVVPKMTKNGDIAPDEPGRLLIEGVQQANLAVHNRNMDQHADMGTTMTAALIIDTMAYVANVGDSRTYLYRESETEGQRLSKITQDHSVVASLVDAGIIKPDDIYTHPKRNQIYRSLGEKPMVEVDGFTVYLQTGDKLLLCSDGLWDMVRDPQIEEVLHVQAPDPAMTGNALIHAALEGGGEDNVSVIVVYVSEEAQRTGMPGIQLLAKPDDVQMPQL